MVDCQTITTDSTTTSGTVYINKEDLNREQYEQDLAERQAEHLRQVQGNQVPWRPCMHDACPDCLGTGIKRTGGICVHGISCPCPKCTPYC